MSKLEIVINRDNYVQATMGLFRLASDDTSGSRTAAQLLLSAYNGNNWQLDVTDLCNLDPEHFRYAMTFMACRSQLFIEPHELLKNGNSLFSKLQQRYYRLHIDNRWKKRCYDCDGIGEKYINPYDDNNHKTVHCHTCNGLGLIPEVSEIKPSDFDLQFFHQRTNNCT